MNKIDREKRVIAQMIGIHCRHKHGTDKEKICPECTALLNYAHARLDRCVKGNNKSSCRKCDIHCYSPSRRNEIRKVMRYVGPRMLFIHPISALRHLWSELR